MNKVRFLILITYFVYSHYCYAMNSDYKIKSWQTLKFDGVIKQELDYSCGSASISTILNSYFQDKWKEDTIISDMTARLNPKELKEKIINGFSMLDMKKTLIRLGYQAVGLKISIEQAHQLRGPVVILLRKAKVNHFVVLRGIINNDVYIADPANGKLRMSLDELKKEWHGEVLAIGKPGQKRITKSKLLISPNEEGHPEIDAYRGWRSFGPLKK